MANARPVHEDQEAELDITLGAAGAQALVLHYPKVKTLYLRYLPDEDDNHGPLTRTYSVTTVSIQETFSVLGDHPSLQHLVLDNVGDMEGDANCHCQFPIRALTLFFQKAKKLKSLQLDMDTAIDGTPEEGQEFLQALREHETLDVLEMGDFGNENSAIVASEFSPISVPRWVELTISHTGDQITAQQVEENIIQSPCLKKLLIDTSNGGFPKQFLARVWEGLQDNILQLTEFNLLDDFNEQRARACAQMIRKNTSLNHLFVALGNEPKNGVLITDALKENSNIHSLRFVLSSQITGEARKLVHNLRQNQSLERIHFHFQGRASQTRFYDCYLKPFEEIMDDNHTLLDIRMDKCHGAFELTPKIEFCLNLNRAGRKELHQTTDQTRYRSLWVDKVIENRSNESVVFYFLSQHPSFLQNDAPEGKETSRNLRKRKAGDLS